MLFRSRERNERFRLLQPKKKRYAHLEKELEQVLGEQREVENLLADPKTYARREHIGELNKKYQDLQERSESIFQELEFLEQEMEALKVRE